MEFNPERSGEHFVTAELYCPQREVALRLTQFATGSRKERLH